MGITGLNSNRQTELIGFTDAYNAFFYVNSSKKGLLNVQLKNENGNLEETIDVTN